MLDVRGFIGALAVLVLVGGTTAAARAETRIALVVGNGAYQASPLNFAANDAGLIAQTLQAAGFDVVGARDLDQDTLRRSFHDFLDKATAAGPDTVAFVYFAGYGIQLEGENYLVPVDARIARATDVPVEALRVSDYLRPLAALKLKATIVVLDAARPNPFARSGSPLAGGLSLIEPEPGVLIAYSAAPGTVAPEGQGPYGAYAQALAEMMRDGGLPLNELFDRVRLRVNDVTKGAEVPWNASNIQTRFVFFERAADAPPRAAPVEQAEAMRDRPMQDLGAQDAYTAALDRDTLQGYLEFLAAYPNDPMAPRVRAIVAARREAITWLRTRTIDTPDAYWSYLRRYPRGPHAADARRRLEYLAAALEPPPSFNIVTYDVPPPPPDEVVYVDRPVLLFDDPDFGFAPPPSPPIFFCPPPPPDFIVLPPPPPIGTFVLPIPVYTPVPLWVRPPVHVRPPPHNIIFANLHDTVVIDNATRTVTITNRGGETRTITPPAAGPGPGGPGGRPGAPVAALGPALPPSVAHKVLAIPTPGSPARAAPRPGHSLPGLPPPGARGRPLPTSGAPLTGLRPGQPLHPGFRPGQASTQPGQPLPAAGGQHPPTPGVIGRKPGQPGMPLPGQATMQPGQPWPGAKARRPITPGVVGPKPGQPPRPDQALIERQRRQQQLQPQLLQQQRQRQVLQQQRQQQMLQQQRQQQMLQLQRQQQMLQQQRQQQVLQQRQQQMIQQRQQQMIQQRQQQMIQQRQMQQHQAAPPRPAPKPACGGRGQPPCR